MGGNQGMNIFTKLTMKTLQKNRSRTWVTIIGVILSTAMITAVTTILSSLQTYMKESVIDAEGHWQAAAGLITEEAAQMLKEAEELEETAFAELQGYAALNDEEKYKPYYCFVGFSKETYQMLNPKLLVGRFPETEDELAISSYMLSRTSTEYNIGDEVTFQVGKRMDNGEQLGQWDGQRDTEELKELQERTFRIVGIFEHLGTESYQTPGYTMITAPTQNSNAMGEFYLTVKEPRQIYSFAKENLNGTTVIFHGSLLRYLGVVDNDNFYTVLQGLVMIIIILIVGGSIALIYNAFSISVSERTKQFGLLSSVGATTRQLRKMILMEAVGVSLVGIPIGIVSGLIGIGITLKAIGKGLENFIRYGTANLHLSVSWYFVGGAALLAIFTVLLSAWIPARRCNKVSPMDAIRQANDIKIPAKKVKTSKLLYRITGLRGVLAIKNYRRSRKKYRSTVVSLVLSMVLFISSSSLVMYAEQSSSLVLETSEVDIYYESYKKESYTYDTLKQYMEEIVAEKFVQKGRILEQLFYELEIDPALVSEEFQEKFGISEHGMQILPCKIYILEDEDFAQFLKEQGVESAPYLNAEQSMGVLFDSVKYLDTTTKKYQQRQILNIHDSLALMFSKGITETDRSQLFQIQENENGLAENSFLLKDQVFEAPYGTEVGRESAYLRILIPRIQYETYLQPWLLQDLSGDSSNYAESSVVLAFQADDHQTAYESIRNYFLERGIVENRDGFLYDVAEETESDRYTMMAVQVLCYGFIILITLIAVANVFHTMSTNISLRRREFAMLRSVGMTQKDLQRVTGYECLLCISRAVLYGIPISFLINILIYKEISAGVETDILFPVKPTLFAIAGVFGIIFCTMWYSVRKLNKENTVDALKNENL